jgi:hypothetical protein
MKRRRFETPLGEVWLHGSAEALEGHTLAMVVLTGAFAAPQSMRAMPGLLREFPVLIGDIPGNGCPRLISQTVGA